MAKVEHFEIPADDIERARAFYGGVFGFTFEKYEDDNYTVRTGSSEGIGGDLHLRSIVPHPTIVITVDNLDETLDAAVAAGGERVGEPQALGENARYAYFKDTEGNIVGVYDSTV